MLILLGKTASGKDSIVKKLISDYGYNKIVTYTTRPMRPGEVDGENYHFISEEEFLNKIDKEEFLEYKVYHTFNGDWFYGSAKDDFINANKRTVIILTPNGYKDFLECLSIPHISILIHTNRFITKRRLLKRGDDKKEIKRRMKHDDIDFLGCNKLVTYNVKNGLFNGLDDVAKNVFKLHMEGE